MRRTFARLAPPGNDEYSKAPRGISDQPLPPGLQPKAEVGATLVTFTLPIECLTPVVGGGAESRTPDDVEGVRIPGIRGQLRMWWRALQPERPDDKELFRLEAALWGGVGLRAALEKDLTKPDALRSTVVLRATTVDKGKDMAAGRYVGERGTYKALPVWEGGAAMGYGLFPLQLERDELSRLMIASPPTRSVRKELKFDLHVSITLLGDNGETEKRLNQVLGSLWAWIHFGGVGSRTTRGFGALALRDRDATNILSSLRVLPDNEAIKKHLKELFPLFKQPSAKDLTQWLNSALAAFGVPGTSRVISGFYPRLPAKALLCGQLRRAPMDALSDGLDSLRTFRQGPGVGRRAGVPKPGRSFWPEANTLRRIAEDKRKVSFRGHAPDPGGPALNGAPRAAFGMPLNTSFKDQEDKVADGVFMPQFGDRWTSPLRMRPLRCTDGYVCLMIYLNQPFPQNASGPDTAGTKVAAVLTRQQRQFPEVEAPVPILSTNGAQGSIQTALSNAGGNAVMAFLDTLSQRGFKKI